MPGRETGHRCYLSYVQATIGVKKVDQQMTCIYDILSVGARKYLFRRDVCHVGYDANYRGKDFFFVHSKFFLCTFALANHLYINIIPTEQGLLSPRVRLVSNV